MSATKPSLRFKYYSGLGELDLQMELPAHTLRELRRAKSVVSTLLEGLRKVGWGELADSTPVLEAYRDLARATERATILENIETLQSHLARLDSPDHELSAAVRRDRESPAVENLAAEEECHGQDI